MFTCNLISKTCGRVLTQGNRFAFAQIIDQKQLDWANTEDKPTIGKLPSSLLMSKWLRDIKDNTEVSKIAIPGTRASASYLLNRDRNTISYQTQTWNITSQLESGVRFLDLNLNFKGSKDNTPDAINYEQFKDVFQNVSHFMAKNPS